MGACLSNKDDPPRQKFRQSRPAEQEAMPDSDNPYRQDVANPYGQGNPYRS
jgi:hypothetical protein